LRERFREDRLGLTASSLTFTTTIALVPLLTVALAVLTAFPMFAKFQDVLQKWLVASLIPDDIARQVLGYLGQFSRKASKLGAFGLGALVLTSLALIFTIDRTLNSIWRVRTLRPITQRLLIYWSALTLGPLILGVSISFSSYAVYASRGLVDSLPGGVSPLLDALRAARLPPRGFLLHAYNGSTQMAKSFADLGAHFSFNGAFLDPRKERLHNLYATLPADRLLVETDAPAMRLPPSREKFPPLSTPEGSIANHPANLATTYAALAALRRVPLDTLAAQVEANFTRLFLTR
jgi:hypothetical protein